MHSEDLEKRVANTFSDCEVAAIDMNGGGNHFELRLSTPDLKPLSRVERHQKIMGIFSEELKTGELHALSIKYIG